MTPSVSFILKAREIIAKLKATNSGKFPKIKFLK